MIKCIIDNSDKTATIYINDGLEDVLSLEDSLFIKEENEEGIAYNILKIISKLSIHLKLNYNAKTEKTILCIDDEYTYSLLKPNGEIISKMTKGMKKKISDNELKLLLGSTLYELSMMENCDVELIGDNSKNNRSEEVDEMNTNIDNNDTFTFEDDSDNETSGISIEDLNKKETYSFKNLSRRESLEENNNDTFESEYTFEDDSEYTFEDDSEYTFENEDGTSLNSEYSFDDESEDLSVGYNFENKSQYDSEYSFEEDLSNKDIEYSFEEDLSNKDIEYSFDDEDVNIYSDNSNKVDEFIYNSTNDDTTIYDSSSEVNVYGSIKDEINIYGSIDEENTNEYIYTENHNNSYESIDNNANIYEDIKDNSDKYKIVEDIDNSKNDNELDFSDSSILNVLNENGPITEVENLDFNLPKNDSNVDEITSMSMSISVDSVEEEFKFLSEYISKKLDSFQQELNKIENEYNPANLNIQDLSISEEELMENFKKSMEMRLRLKVIKKSFTIYNNLKEQLDKEINKQ